MNRETSSEPELHDIRVKKPSVLSRGVESCLTNLRSLILSQIECVLELLPYNWAIPWICVNSRDVP